MSLRNIFIILLGTIYITPIFAGGSIIEKKNYFFQLGTRYSHTQTITDFKLQGVLDISKITIRWVYKIGLDALTDPIKKYLWLRNSISTIHKKTNVNLELSLVLSPKILLV